MSTRNRKWIGLGSLGLLLGVCLVLAALFGGKLWGGGTSSVDWDERASVVQAAFQEQYWDEKRGLFNNAAPCMLQLCTDPFHYWWQAHALDVLIDGYERTADEAYRTKVDAMYQGILDRNGAFPNLYYDDMEWMALAWLRAYDVWEDERYREAADILWKDIQTGWNDAMGGGIAWRKEQLDYKNTPANAPAVILAARLYERFGDPADLDWAKKIYDWQKETLVDPETGLVWDGINRQGDGRIDKEWQFTYGQGVYIGAGVALYRATGEQGYLDDAKRTATYVLEQMTSPEGQMLPSEGGDDGGLFKGILVRYLGELIREDEESTELAQMLETNAESLWTFGMDGERKLFGPAWTQTPEQVVQMSTQLSGMMLLEQVAKLQDEGRID